VGCKEGAHLIFGGGERQISNVKFRHRTTHKKRDNGDRRALSSWFANTLKVSTP
jgi:hypothetical protein